MSRKGGRRPAWRRQRGRRARAIQIVPAALVALDVADRAKRRFDARREDLLGKIKVHTIGRDTAIEIDHSVPNPEPRWRFTTVRHQLPKSWFCVPGSGDVQMARGKADAAADRHVKGRRKGRVLYCVDLKVREVVAALVYHIPRSRGEPILVTAVALRTGLRDDGSGWEPEAFIAAYLGKRYLHALGRKCGHPSYVDFVADDRTLSVDLGLLGFPEIPSTDASGEVRYRQMEDF